MAFWHYEKLTLFLTVVILTISFIPISCHYVRIYYLKLHENPEDSQIKKLLDERYGVISFYEAILTITNMILTPICMAIWIYCDVEATTTKILLYVFLTLFDLSLFIVFVLWIYRFWLIKFKMSFTSATLNDLWKSCINPTAIKLPWHYKFYLKYQTKMGNIEWIGNKIILGSIIGLMTIFYLYSEAVFYFGDDYQEQTATTAFTFMYCGIRLILWLILLIVYCSIPDFQDVWYVKKELRRLLVSLSILILALFVGDGVTYYRQFLSVKTKAYNSYGISNAMEIIVVCCKFATIMISTEWVLGKLESKPKSVCVEFPGGGTKASISDVELLPRSSHENHLIQIFKDERHFELFLVYLSKEFRVKPLLAFIEIIQFREFVMANHSCLRYENDEEVTELWKEVEFYDNMPQSEIVHRIRNNGNDEKEVEDEKEQKYEEGSVKTNISKQIQNIANDLFEKYMEYGYANTRYGSPWTFEFKSRERIDVELGDYNWKENVSLERIMDLFNNAANDIWNQFLFDSFGRFEKTKEYKDKGMSANLQYT